jgi:hypothetical protein
MVAKREAQPDLSSKTSTVAENTADARDREQSLADQQSAKTKAEALAVSDAERAKALDDEARKNEAASRSDNRSAKPSASASPSASSGVNAGPVPASCSAYTGNKAVGCSLVVKAGLGLDQMACLDKLFTKESGWKTSAKNSSSGAYGIPQALPGSKMAVFGSDWQTNPATQISWGLSYIKSKYSTPCGAWSHSQSTGWY